MFNSIVPLEHVLGQYYSDSLEQWKDVPMIDELPFLLQKQEPDEKLGPYQSLLDRRIHCNRRLQVLYKDNQELHS
jgi:hypothetical protein